MSAPTASAPMPTPAASVLPVRPGSRADRLTKPRARDVVTEAAIEFGVCIRPVLLRRTDLTTGETQVIETPCGSTRGAVCPPCADRARRLRAQQCREGWHLAEEPDLTPDPPTDEQRDLVRERAETTAALDDARDRATCTDPDPGDLDDVEELTGQLADLDDALAGTGARGAVVPPTARRKRSTKRRDDVPDLPRRPSTGSTLGRTFTDTRTGRTFRPSLFVTLTMPSYGRVRDDGTPVDPGRYDYRGAARDALHFGKLLDRWCQNLRRVAGYDVQYFAAVEPQRRGAPHAHYAIRGTLPRAVVKELTAATYVNVWWPATDTPIYQDGHLPEWDEDLGQYVDPDTGQPLPTWGEALEDLDDDPDAQPRHTVRFGTQVDVKGVLAGSPEAERAIGYLVKYLVKDLGEDLDQGEDDVDQGDELPNDVRAEVRAARVRRADHLARLVDALRFEPCSPACANWLRYGIQPKNAKPRMRPGCCRTKAHRPTHLGYGGRRVLVSRKWTAKDLRDHRHDRRDHVRAVLQAAGIDPDHDDSATENGQVSWGLARPTDPDVPPRHHRLLRSIADAHRRRTQYRAARDSPGTPVAQQGNSSTERGGTAA